MKKVFIAVIIFAIGTFTVVEYAVNGLDAIYFPLTLLAFCLIPVFGYLSSRMPVIFGFSPFQLPIPLAPQLSHIGMFLTLPGLIVDSFTGRLEFDKYLRKGPYIILFLGSICYLGAMLINLISVDQSLKSLYSNVGGRVYIKHFLFLLAPLSIICHRIRSEALMKYMKLGWLLSFFHIFLDLCLYFSPSYLQYLTLIMQLPVDFSNFHSQAESGITRFASVGLAGIGVGFYCLSEINDKRPRWLRVLLYLIVVICFAASAMSGYRRYIVIIPFALAMCILIRRKISISNLLGTVLFFTTMTAVLYWNYEDLPESIQRSAFILPNISDGTAIDFSSTRANDGGRDAVSDYNMRLLRDNWLFGIGYFHNYNLENSLDPVIAASASKNNSLGFLSALLNLGLLGLIASILIMFSGLWLCVDLFFFFFSKRECDVSFAPLAGIAISYFLYNLFYYCFQHGNSPYFFAQFSPSLFCLFYLDKYRSNLFGQRLAGAGNN